MVFLFQGKKNNKTKKLLVKAIKTRMFTLRISVYALVLLSTYSCLLCYLLTAFDAFFLLCLFLVAIGTSLFPVS